MKLVATLALLISLVALGLTLRGPHPTGAVTQETALARVLRTGTLRCGYYVFPPMVIRDPNTNEFSGFAVDLMNHIAEKAGLKIEWTEEITFGNWIPALQAGHFDAVCSPMWPDAALAREALFTHSMMYASLSPVVRADDHRFDGDLAKLNDPLVTFVAQEGNITLYLTKEVFPRAKLIVLSANTDPATMMLNVMSGKADAILWDRNALIKFNGSNGATARMLSPDHPVKAQPFALVTLQGEFGLEAFLDSAVDDLVNTGTIDRLLTKWEPAPGVFLRVAVPYQMEKP